MKKYLPTLCLTLAAAAFSLPANAQVFVHGSGKPFSCFQSVKTGNPGHTSAIRECTEALSDAAIRSDVAASHINRGVLYMRRGDTMKAIEDFETGLRIRPSLDEGYINLGAAYYYAGDDEKALSALNTALEMETEKRAEALFNRALVYDRAGDLRSAYYDLKEVLEIMPEWEDAQVAISRYTVTRKT